MRCAAYIVGSRLCALGVENTSMGPVPLASYVDLGADAPQGVIDLSDIDEMPEHVKEGIKAISQDLNDQLAISQLQASVAQTVSRAREGDQNAMAILSLMGERARKGNPRALTAAKAVEAYIRANPYRRIEIGQDPISSEFEESPVLKSIAKEAEGPAYALALAVQLPCAPRTMATVLTLVHGPALTQSLLVEVAEGIEEEDEGAGEIFLSGADRSHDDKAIFSQARAMPEEKSNVLLAGRLAGMARTIQAVCMGQWSEKAMSKNIAWELGA